MGKFFTIKAATSAFTGFLLLLVCFASAQTEKIKALPLPGEMHDTAIVANAIPANVLSKVEDRNPVDIFMQKHTRPPDLSLFSKDSLSMIVDYKATDSAIFLSKENMFYLYKDADVKNTDNDISSNTIEFNRNTNIVKAYGAKDTSNEISSRPTILQKDSKSIMDTAYFNVKSQKGILKNTFYNEGEIYVQANIAKKVDSNSIFIKDARFTTCNLDPPHFDFHAWKLKMITNKLAVSGPAIPEIEGVPLPIIVPFGIYPLINGRHSGLLPPMFDQNSGYGLGLTGLGYYKVINDNWDVTARGNVYTYGGYTVTLSPEYYKRYHYRGNLSFSYQHSVILSSGVTNQEYQKGNTMHLNWSHSMDSKALPGISFSASVDAGSTKFNSYIPNNPYQNFNNNLTSSITFSKNWNQGKYNLSASATSNQNSNTNLINLQLPNLNFSMTTLYPFQKKNSAKSKWYDNVGISYTGTFSDNLSFYDTVKNNIHSLLDTLQWGVQHSIPISLTLPALGPLLFTPSVSFQSNWYGNKTLLNWDPVRLKVDTTINKGFYMAEQASFGIATNTSIFGTVNFKNGGGIRHTVRPTIGFTFTPNMNSGAYRNVQIDTTGYQMNYSVYSIGNVSPAFGNGANGSVNFGIDNVFEMKVPNNSDTTGDPDKRFRKISLIDGLGINTSYNLLADSLNWAPVSINLRTSLFKNKLSVTSNMSIDQYAYDSHGNRTNKLLWTEGQIGHITNGSLSLSTSFSSKKADSHSSDSANLSSDSDMPLDQQEAQLNYIRSNPGEFVDFNIPWNVQVSFAMSFNRVVNPDYSGFHNVLNGSLNLNGDFSLSPKWKAGGSLYFDVLSRKIGMMTLFVTRDMHCWQMAINITPIGYYKSFSIVLNPKSGILRDLRINRSRSFYQY